MDDLGFQLAFFEGQKPGVYGPLAMQAQATTLKGRCPERKFSDGCQEQGEDPGLASKTPSLSSSPVDAVSVLAQWAS